MNQVQQTKAFEGTPDKPAFKPDQAQRVRLTQGDARALHSVLIKGDTALAQRSDLGDLYKRIVTMISTLDSGLSERQAAQAQKTHALLSTRLDSMERTINEVEGALRIEMEPLLRKAVNETLDDRLSLPANQKRPSFGTRLLQILVLCIFLYIGSLFSVQIEGLTEGTLGYLSELISGFPAVLPPDGGI